MKKYLVLLIVLLMLVGCGNKNSDVEVVQTDETETVDNVQDQTVNSTIDYLDALSIWGLDPGLGVNVLHEQGYTGKGVTVAYIDQVIDEKYHSEYADSIVEYTDVSNPKEQPAFHGYAVLSLLCGKNLGVAPDINVHYYSTNSNDDIQLGIAECFKMIIEKNKELRDDKKIKMVALSNNISSERPGDKEAREAEKALQESGVMVWWCGENDALAFEEFSDKTNINNIKPIYTSTNPQLCFVPSGSRTRAHTGTKIDSYKYDESGGLSWTMPYTFGLYSIALSIDSTLSQDDMRKLIVDTASYNDLNMRIVNPIGFVSAVLRRANRNEDADRLEKAYKQSFNYIYAVYNSNKLTNDDINSIKEFTKTLNNAYIVLFDCKNYKNANEIYDAIKQDINEKEGNIIGVQIFGNSDIVPSFEINYKVDTVGSIDDAGYFYTDLFYQNLNNDSSLINRDYSIYSQFENNLNIDLIPQYPLARLSLASGEFSAYFKKFSEYAAITNLKKQTLVNFSNPIFASEKHIDDMSYFLNRMKDEFDCIDDDYILYGNQKGQYPVKTSVIGDFKQENLKKVNSEDIVEFLINSHGQKDNIDICYYENGNEKRQSLINTSNINSILSDNYYYIDAWTCQNGADMKDNIASKALNGKCIGYFGATHIISNNGVDCYASFDNLKYCNFYYFYYKYLKSINNGYPRSYAFFLAQNSYAKVLLETSKDGMNAANGFNLCNLLAYHNFGVLEPYEYNENYINKEDTSLTNTTLKTAIKKYDNISLDGSLLSTFDVDIYDYYCVFNDDGSCTVSLVIKTNSNPIVSVFIPPSDVISVYSITDELSLINQNLTKEMLENELINISVSKANDDRCFIGIDPLKLSKWSNKPKSDYQVSEIYENNSNTNSNNVKKSNDIKDNKKNSNNDNNDSIPYTLGTDQLVSFEVDIRDYYYSVNSDGDYEITFSLNVPNGVQVCAFIPPDNVLKIENINKGGLIDFKFTWPKKYQENSDIALSIGLNDNDRYFIGINQASIKNWKKQ